MKLSRTRFVLGCRSEVGCDGVSPPMPISRTMMKTRDALCWSQTGMRNDSVRRQTAQGLSIYVGNRIRGWLWTERDQK